MNKEKEYYFEVLKEIRKITHFPELPDESNEDFIELALQLDEAMSEIYKICNECLDN